MRMTFLLLLFLPRLIHANPTSNFLAGYFSRLITNSEQPDDPSLQDVFALPDFSKSSLSSLFTPTLAMRETKFHLSDEQADLFIDLINKSIQAGAMNNTIDLIFEKSGAYLRNLKILHFLIADKELEEKCHFTKPTVTDFLRRSTNDSFFGHIQLVHSKCPLGFSRMPLELILNRNNPQTLTFFLDKTGFDVNRFDYILKVHCRPYCNEKKQTYSLFKEAILADDVQSVAIMLKRGADPFIKDWREKDAFSWVQRCRHHYQEIKGLLDHYEKPVKPEINLGDKIGSDLKWFFTGGWIPKPKDDNDT